MKIEKTFIDDLLVINPKVHGDDRGYFFESFNLKSFHEFVSNDSVFVQDNQSKSVKGVLRGLHYQYHNPQGKLVRAIHGQIYDVAVDLRTESDTYGDYFGILLSAENKKQLWIPKGFAHGFLVVTDTAEVSYKTTDYYNPDDEHVILWSDPTLAIDWPDLKCPYKLSMKDESAIFFKEARHFGEI